MTMRHVSDAIWVAVFALFGVVAFATHLTGMEDERGLIRLLTSTPARRVLMLIGWMWLGWHFFAR